MTAGQFCLTVLRTANGSKTLGGGAMVSDGTRIMELKYEFIHPVELTSFTASLDGLADIHRVQASKMGESQKDARLFIREVRKGSVEVDLVEMVKVAGGALAPAAAATHATVETLSRVKSIFNWLRGEDTAPPDVTKREIEAASRFVAPVAENNGSVLNLKIENSPNSTVIINSLDANAMQNAAHKAIAAMKVPEKRVLTEVPLVWHQTDRQGASKGKTGMEAIVEDVFAFSHACLFC